MHTQAAAADPTASAAPAATPSPVPRPDPGSPPYARVTLALIALLTAVLSTWGTDRSRYHVFYAAAVRSMTQSPSAFFYGAFDPGGAITIDKLPGFLWPQALSAMLFGMHPWALVLPQGAEMTAAVLVLYTVVRRWSGAPTALAAAAFFALTPVTVGLGRSIVEDALFTLLLLLAAEAAQRAVHSGRTRPLLVSGLWVGLAFQCKMVEAWAVLPALAAAYLVSAPASLRRRLTSLALAGAVTAAVSLTWVAAAWATPPQDRPYLDGTSDNSPFSLVFGYNFLNRFGTVGLDASGTGSVTAAQHSELAGLAKMFSPGIVSQTGWLYPLAALGLLLGLGAARRLRGPRTDRYLAGLLLWGVWLLTFFAAFSAGSVAGHTYYMGAVAVPLAALAANGLLRGLEAARSCGRRSWLLPGALAADLALAALVAWRYPAFLPWLTPAAAVLTAGAIALLRAPALRATALRLPRGGRAAKAVGTADGVRIADDVRAADGRADGGGPAPANAGAALRHAGRPNGGAGRLLAAGAAGLSLLSALLAPAAWSFSALDPRYSLPGGMARVGPTSPQGRGGAAAPSAAQRQVLAYLTAHRDGARYLAAVPAWTDATPYILGDGAALLPMGGFTGQVPFPTLAAFRHLVAAGQVRYVIPHPGGTRSPTTAQVMAWVAGHCPRVADPAAGPQPLYRCGGPG